ncbi:hypothetical protein [Pseudomonas migulae]|uniref:Ig-like domain (Group 3) n=1 Tax=Pseudomonas migulae TaxID=78543 RepID=A0A1H5HDC4_9PSED|nr:hypothetical protein [Pseudomonas migulae]SEE25754.1 hypothetical protein SAMN04490194_1559 [Pseudomonas migulae]
MTDFPSNDPSSTLDELVKVQPQFRRLDDSKGTAITNRTTFDRQIRITGYNIQPNSNVIIKNFDEDLGSAQSDDAGEFVTELLTLSNYDCHEVRIVGNYDIGPASLPRKFTAARERPAITQVSSDGEPVSPGDTISGPTVTVVCDSLPNVDSRAFNGETLLKTELVDRCGKVTFELDLQPGDYSITIKDPDNKESDAFTFTVREVAVTPVTLDKVTTATGVEVDDGTTTSETSLFVEGEGEPGAKVEVFKNGVTLDEATVDPSTGRYRHPTGELTDDTYIFTVTAKYIGGGTAGPHTITVEAIKKQVTLDKVTTATGVEVDDGTTTSETSLFVEGEGEPGAKVEVFKNGVTMDEATVDPSTGRYRHPTGELTDDTYIFTVTAKYIGGGTAGPHTITVEAATAAPTDTRIYDAEGNVILDGGDINKRWLIARGLHTPNSTVKIKLNGVIQTKTEPTSDEGKWVSFQNDLTVGQTYVISALTLDEKAESNTWSVVARSPSKS